MSEAEILPPGTNEPAPGLSQWQRVGYVFTNPSKTFMDIKRGNRSWWLPLILLALFSYLFFAAVTQKIGIEQAITNQFSYSPQTEERLAQLPPAQRETNIRIAVDITRAVFIAQPALVIIELALLSFGLLGTINFAFGGKASYAGILSMWFYAWLPELIKPFLGTVAVFAGMAPESFNIKNFSPTNIGAFLDPATTNHALYALLTSLDVVTIWALILLSVGTATLAGVKRRSGYLAVFGWWALFVLFRVGVAAFAG